MADGQRSQIDRYARSSSRTSRILETAYRGAAELFARAFDEDKMAKAGTYQLVVASGMAIDKARLLAGESTSNVEVHTKLDILGLDN